MDNSKNKVCKRCNDSKPWFLFYSHKRTNDGLSSYCKECFSKYRKQYHLDNREAELLYRREYVSNNREKAKIAQRNSYYKHYDKYLVTRRNYARRKRKTDVYWKLAHSLRSRLKTAIRHNYKSGSAIQDLGCSINEFKTHLEKQFKEGMSWDNHGTHGWHIDHIIPLSSFDLTNREELLKACHYTNLQHLWWHENLSKGTKQYK